MKKLFVEVLCRVWSPKVVAIRYLIATPIIIIAALLIARCAK